MAQAACWPVGPQGIGPLLRSGSIGPVPRGRLLLIDALRGAEWLATHLGIGLGIHENEAIKDLEEPRSDGAIDCLSSESKHHYRARH
jgi:hypothetical protein